MDSGAVGIGGRARFIKVDLRFGDGGRLRGDLLLERWYSSDDERTVSKEFCPEEALERLEPGREVLAEVMGGNGRRSGGGGG